MAEIRQRLAKTLVIPVPPRQRGQAVRNVFGKPPPDGPRRVSGNDSVGRNVPGYDGAGGDHRAAADAATRQYDRAMSDPDIVTDIDVIAAPPCEEIGLVRLAGEISAGAIGEMRLRRR